ncbi:MAG: M23 family metallopeptidase [Clostridia bacterium]|nr:M23 family metallopeptidase [Clostridia bacterium]
MRRDTRRRQESEKWWEDKRIIISGAVILAIIVLIMGISIYSKNLIDDTSKVNPNQIISLTPEEEIKENTESASSTIGNKINETEETQTNNTNVNTSANTNKENTKKNNTTNTTSAKETAEKITKKNSENKKEENNSKEDEKKDTKQTSNNAEKISFDWPVKGDILKKFSIDNLLYSSTLQEWTVHNGIDIKADKASVVSAAADGVVKSIKNDPRYGLTVTIEHSDGYKTVYSNLLTAEFIVEGEKVSKGQNIGTVGNTANFEVADDFHLHFEILKDSEYIDPMIYLK